MKKTYDCIIVGGGIAGLQAAIQLGRYEHDILVVDSSDGRSSICRSYHNLLGWPDGVSGEKLRSLGRQQAEAVGVEFQSDRIVTARKDKGEFILDGKDGYHYVGRKLLLATGIMDNIPKIKNLLPCLGLSVYVCPDCDGYEVKNKKVVILGSGEAGAEMAQTIHYWTDEITYINHESKEVTDETRRKLEERNIRIVEGNLSEAIVEGDSDFKGVRLKNGVEITGEKGFIAFGGNKVHTELARELGVEILDNKHINADARSKETNVEDVWAAGDIVAHSEQVSTAMGDGSIAAIWIHKKLLLEKK
ncbi:NAD(P)/FAD-dependent oxidoreductase [Rossellomorea vietnamensis]|uniref:NAD(P)/FAD-dependent oxidoreductase n=1 Tax=Rossellomorea vietnamensis TaxID=218284 RepID=A0A5D4NWS6_9BACI|nr:NAD(P)/FAD-dependent oxidoreductase [Rossellomorea vietnamensis]TYS18697.1 NAD(P)/FAD-dependent oxidoreductase [Rossellomorea vietnamensis]